MKLILNSNDKGVVGACLSCLGSIVNNVTKNYSLMRECFKKYYKNILKFSLRLPKFGIFQNTGLEFLKLWVLNL